ncbi:hypothetical protein [Acinetobacter ursingii]|uniref:hypothetical protein n=1 Tax=Acinetobacter ursingii TaxID=108980 RepID=UPI001C077C7C|nr:hypothetical protein [Acinetobacter ursingii]
MNAHKFVAVHGIEKAKAVLGGAPEFVTHVRQTNFGNFIYYKIENGELRVWIPIVEVWSVSTNQDYEVTSLSELKQVVESVEFTERKGGLNRLKKESNCLFYNGFEGIAENYEKAIADYELVESFKSSNDQIVCWSCNQNMPSKQHGNNDGFCIHCNAEIEILDMVDVSPCCEVRNG